MTIEWYLATQWRFVGCRGTQWPRVYVRVKVQLLLEEKVSGKVSGSRQALTPPPSSAASSSVSQFPLRITITSIIRYNEGSINHYDDLLPVLQSLLTTSCFPLHNHSPSLNICTTYYLPPDKDGWQTTSSIKSCWL